MASDEVSEKTVYDCTGQPLPTDIGLIVEWMLNESFKDAYQSKITVFFSFRLLLFVVVIVVYGNKK